MHPFCVTGFMFLESYVTHSHLRDLESRNWIHKSDFLNPWNKILLLSSKQLLVFVSDIQKAEFNITSYVKSLKYLLCKTLDKRGHRKKKEQEEGK